MRNPVLRNQILSTLRPRQLALLLSCWAVIGYFGHHIAHGRHGLETRARLTERAQLLSFEIKTLHGVRSRLAHDVALLTPAAPDADLVEELAREVLGYVAPADHVLTRR